MSRSIRVISSDAKTDGIASNWLTERKKVSNNQGAINQHITKRKDSLYSFNELPEWLKFNQWIKNGYRLDYSFKQCLISIFTWHNESINVWSHGLGFLLVFILTIYSCKFLLSTEGDWIDYLFLLVYVIAIESCLLASTAYHLFHCHSETVCYCTMKFDYSSISIVVLCSFITPLYYIFYNEVFYRNFYIIGITLVAGSSVLGPLFKFYNQPRWHYLRVSIIFLASAFGLAPVAHMYTVPGIIPHSYLYNIWLMYGCYGIGAFIYLTKYPERLLPGKFDYIFASHQIWHCCVLGGMLIHYNNCLIVYQLRKHDLINSDTRACGFWGIIK